MGSSFSRYNTAPFDLQVSKGNFPKFPFPEELAMNAQRKDPELAKAIKLIRNSHLRHGSPEKFD
jgi:hypothetical protein